MRSTLTQLREWFSAWRGLIPAVIVVSAAPSASANVQGSYDLLADGTVRYQYRVDNSQGSFDIASWSLDLGLSAPDWNPLDVPSGGDVSVPASGWISGPGTPIVGAFALDFLSLTGAGEIAIGEDLGGFSFVSRYLPGPVSYHEFSATGEPLSGTTVGPFTGTVPVPDRALRGANEFLAALVLAGFSRWQRGRRTAS